VWRWQARFMAEGVEGLTRDKTRKPGKQPLPTGIRMLVGWPGQQASIHGKPDSSSVRRQAAKRDDQATIKPLADRMAVLASRN
jgi:hypothetical protein